MQGRSVESFSTKKNPGPRGEVEGQIIPAAREPAMYLHFLYLRVKHVVQSTRGKGCTRQKFNITIIWPMRRERQGSIFANLMVIIVNRGNWGQVSGGHLISGRRGYWNSRLGRPQAHRMGIRVPTQDLPSQQINVGIVQLQSGVSKHHHCLRRGKQEKGEFLSMVTWNR